MAWTFPTIALGTYNLCGASGVDSMVSGIEAGYRMLDSAFNYENEGALGAAVRRCGIPREDLRLVSKLPGRHQRYDEAVYTLEESLMRAGLDYWDMYLIHWPNPKRGLYVEAFQALLDARRPRPHPLRRRVQLPARTPRPRACRDRRVPERQPD